VTPAAQSCCAGEGEDVERLRARLAELERRELVGLLVIGVVVVAAALVWYWRSLPRPVRIEASMTASAMVHSSDTPAAAGVSPTPGPELVVDVAGWVRHPGVYRFHQGDRVIDAIDAAGGAKPGANLTAINEAALLQDAQQILVAKRGAGGGGGAGSPAGGGAGSAGGKINLNTATLDQLESLPGIGEVIGQRIIDYRQQHGPFSSVDDLLDVSGIGPSHLADVKDLVTV
jgi:competence protein ComEA